MQYAMVRYNQKQTKAMDMRFHWLRDRECQKQMFLGYIGGLVSQTMQIIGQSITLQHITKEQGNIFITPCVVLEMPQIEKRGIEAAAAAA